MTYESREALEKVLLRLAELARADPALLEASRGKQLTVSMEFPDLESFFHIRFDNGNVDAGLGEPQEPPTAELVLDSDVFDGIFSGQVNPAKAAMKGELAFSGNASAAMRFQSVLSDFVRLYNQAKKESGLGQ